MTIMSFIPKTSPDLRRTPELKCAFETLKDCKRVGGKARSYCSVESL